MYRYIICSLCRFPVNATDTTMVFLCFVACSVYNNLIIVHVLCVIYNIYSFVSKIVIVGTIKW